MATNREVQIKYVFIELYKKAYPSLEKKETVQNWTRPMEPSEKRSGKVQEMV